MSQLIKRLKWSIVYFPWHPKAYRAVFFPRYSLSRVCAVGLWISILLEDTIPLTTSDFRKILPNSEDWLKSYRFPSENRRIFVLTRYFCKNMLQEPQETEQKWYLCLKSTDFSQNLPNLVAKRVFWFSSLRRPFVFFIISSGIVTFQQFS